LTLASSLLFHLGLVVNSTGDCSAGHCRSSATTNAMTGNQGKGWFSILDLLAGAVMVIVPRRLRWSSRSTRLLSLCGLILLGKRPLLRLVGLERHESIGRISEATIGTTLIGAQYLLSEEDSSVRGSIAALGGLLLLRALLRRK